MAAEGAGRGRDGVTGVDGPHHPALRRTREEDLYLTAFKSLLEPSVLVDEAHRIVSLNDAARRLLAGRPVTPGELFYERQIRAVSQDRVGVDFEASALPAEDALVGSPLKKCLPMVDHLLEVPGDAGAAWHREITLPHGDDATAYVVSCSPMHDPSGTYRGSVLFFTNITDRKSLESELRELSERDPLTGVSNRRHFETVAAAEVLRARREGEPLCVVSIDLDHFKRINDERGHPFGDKALVHAARICQKAGRRSDLLARIGGEEFMLLLPRTSLATAVDIAERLRLRIALEGRRLEEQTLALTASLGIAPLDLQTGSVETLFADADRALYAAKRAGRNAVRVSTTLGPEGTEARPGTALGSAAADRGDHDIVTDIITLTRSVGRSHEEEFHRRICQALASTSASDLVLIAELEEARSHARTRAVILDGQAVDNFVYDLQGTPCNLVSQDSVCIYPRDVISEFPDDQILIDLGMQAYIGLPVFDSHDRVTGVLALMRRTPIRNQEHVLTLMDIASTMISAEMERSDNERRIASLVEKDPLTGCASKAALLQHLRAPGRKGTLLAAIENFSTINNAYGLPKGDAIIRRTAEIIRENFCFGFCASIGPTKFALVLNADADLEALAGAIRAYFTEHPVTADGLTVYLSFAFGAARGEHNTLRLASEELRVARRAGRMRGVCVREDACDADFREHQRHIEISNLIHVALREHLVVPVFQRIVSLEDRSTHKVEALARIHYEDQVLMPAQFIDTAGAAGALPELTRQMITATFEAMEGRDLDFTLNMTSHDLDEGYLLPFLKSACAQRGITPSQVTLEILENISASSKEAHISQLKAIKEAGFKLAIDDFGAEYSNFSRILDLDVDYVKIDAKYVTKVCTDDRCREIIRAIVFFCENAGISSIAEHVDSEEIAATLRTIGVTYGQGYLFAPPGPIGTARAI